MQIKTSSWHYKILRLYRQSNPMPADLCSYVWAFILEIPCKTICLIFLSPVFLGLVVLLGIIFGVGWVGTKLIERCVGEFGTYKEPLLVTYLKAKKEKICPTIEYED